MNKLSPKQGFTLVELMVVISIIAILSIIGAVYYSSVQIRSRDNQRVNDLKVIEAVLEQYYADQNNFPVTLPTPPMPLAASGKTYLSQIPQDPINPIGSPYVYKSFNSVSPGSGTFNFNCGVANICNGFCLSAKMEGNTPASTHLICSLPGGYNYQVNSLNPNSNN